MCATGAKCFQVQALSACSNSAWHRMLVQLRLALVSHLNMQLYIIHFSFKINYLFIHIRKKICCSFFFVFFFVFSPWFFECSIYLSLVVAFLLFLLFRL